MLIRNISIYKIFSCISVIFISGCTDFHEKFQPEQLEWAKEKGDKQLIVRGYALKTDDVTETSCIPDAGEASLWPDTPYYRDWMRIQRVKFDPFRAHIKKKALKYVRYSKWQDHCIYSFDNVPAGHWLVMINIGANWKTGTAIDVVGNMYRTRVIRFVEADYAYVPLEIKAEDKTVKKNVFMDYRKRNDVGFLKIRVHYSPGEISDWTDPK